MFGCFNHVSVRPMTENLWLTLSKSDKNDVKLAGMLRIFKCMIENSVVIRYVSTDTCQMFLRQNSYNSLSNYENIG